MESSLSSAESLSTPHPWSLNSAVNTLVDPYKSVLPKKPPAKLAAAREDETRHRMLLDDHRSNYGRCDRCEDPWPCAVVREIRCGSAA
jgi:hypothetical protein